MEDNENHIIYFCIIMFLILLAAITIRHTDRMDQIENEIDQLKANTSTTEANTEANMEPATEAPEVTPTEPDEVSISLRPEFTTETTEELTEITTETSTEITTEVTTEAVTEAPEEELTVVYDAIKDDGNDANNLVVTNTYYAEDQNNYAYMGSYQLTAYIATGSPCADGVYPQVGYTVACNDPALWHKWIYIDGYGSYYVHDTGGMASNVIDIFMGSYSDAIQFGRRSADIFLIE